MGQKPREAPGDVPDSLPRRDDGTDVLWRATRDSQVHPTRAGVHVARRDLPDPETPVFGGE